MVFYYASARILPRKMGNLCVSELFHGDSGGIPTSPALMKHTPIPYNWKEYIYSTGSSWVFQSNDKDKARQAVFLTPLNPFGKDPEEKKPHFDYTVHQKFHMKLVGNATKMLYILGAIEESAGSRVAILANEIRRLH